LIDDDGRQDFKQSSDQSLQFSTLSTSIKRQPIKMIKAIFVLAMGIGIQTSAFLSPIKSHVQHRRLVSVENGLLPTTKLHLFGFGDGDKTNDNELARFSNLLVGGSNIDAKMDSLSIMISSWSKFFLDHKSMGLTTAVDVVDLPKTIDSAGVQLLFKKGVGGRSAYNDKDEEEKGEKKEDSIREGGVQVLVKKLTGGNLEVVATRCEIDEGTMIKEMSEQAIIESLGKAMQAWKKEQLVCT
jgi:hypothetical protein